ncbi:MAG: FAD-binding protein, partial [Cytophagales bacterium]
MNVLVYIESVEGVVKKSSLEAIAYGKALAKLQNGACVAVALGTGHKELEKLGNAGADKVLQFNQSNLDIPNAMNVSSALKKASEISNAQVIVLPKSSLSDSIAGRLAVKMKAGAVSNVTEIADISQGFVLKRAIYTGKAFSTTEIKSTNKIIVIKKNAVALELSNNIAVLEHANVELGTIEKSVERKDVQKATGTVLLPEAEIVVSGGRGLKGPENWGIIEDLAKTLGAATEI